MKYTESNGYIVTEIDGRDFVIDTGCPRSFNFCGLKSINIDGRQHPVNGMIQCQKENADRITGMNIDGFIGVDIISNTNLSIDYANKEVFFCIKKEQQPDPALYFMPFDLLDLLMNYYIITDKIIINDMPLPYALIDTGAPISYVSSDILSGLEPDSETYADESPLMGKLNGHYYSCNMRFSSMAATLNIPVKVGVMQGELSTLSAFGIKGIIDASLLSRKYVVFDFDKNMLGIALDERSR